MTMKEGERQVAPTVDGIRRDPLARYELAAKRQPSGARVIDFACGVGYGTSILAAAGHLVHGYDIDAEALAYAREHYAHERATFIRQSGNDPESLPGVDCAVCFETIEHIEDPRPLLKALREATTTLIASVPNESVMPWMREDGAVTEFHFRHYTKLQFTELLRECGWCATEWFGQEGPKS
jgi:2-polyprenyl-3-methyl-5-hydroxy-6-metoxy-1,4-benzoquinol methylase